MNKKVVVGVQPDLVGTSHSDKWAEFLAECGATVRILNLLAPDALEQARQCDGVMWRWAHTAQDKQSSQRILYIIEHYLGIPVYPDSSTAWHYDEKVAQFYLFQALQIPAPRTWLFWNREEALTWARTAPYPVVFKLSVGASSANVIKVENEDSASALINRMFRRGVFPMTMNEFRMRIPPGLPHSPSQAKATVTRLLDALRYVWRAEYPALRPVWWKPEYGYAYFQEFLPHNEFDTRISVIGNRAFGFQRFNRHGDFRASGSGRIEYDPAAIDLRCVETAFEVSERGGFQSMAYDFLYREGEPVICEISYAYVDWAVHDCPGHWRVDLSWSDGQMWPEEAHVEDFLRRLETRRKEAI